MIDAIVGIISRILYGKSYLEGFGQEPSTRDEYTLSSVFPNEKVMRQVNVILEKREQYFPYPQNDE